MYRKELSYYFSTPIAYIVVGLYLLAISLFLWVIPGEWNIIDSGYAQVDGLFQLSPWMLMLVCPALTMRLFAEERQSGIWDLLMTKPYPLWRIVIDKYMAAFTLLLIALIPCLTHYFVVAYIAEPQGNLDLGQFIGSLFGLILLSSSFMGIGLFLSSLAKSQIVSFLLGAVGCLILYWVLLQDHYTALSRGVIDFRDVVAMLSVSISAIIITIPTLQQITRK